MKDLLIQIEDWLSKGRQLVLATVIKTWGSSPRTTGAGMVIEVVVWFMTEYMAVDFVSGAVVLFRDDVFLIFVPF